MKKKRIYSCIGTKVVSALTALTVLAPNVAQLSVAAEEPEKYPYLLFGRNGLTITATSNLCVNGNVHTNKKIAVTFANGNLNGTITSCADIEKRIKHIYSDQAIMSSYFSDNCMVYEDAYINSEMNIHINSPTFSCCGIELNGNISLNSYLGTYMDIDINGEVENANNAVLYAKYGDITIDTDSVANLNGLIYAPLGTVTIDAPNINLNGVLIADEIIINGSSVNMNASDSVAHFIGNTSEIYDFSGLEYLPEDWLGDSDEDGLFDIYEKVIDSNPLNPDTDDDKLPDGYEVLVLKTDPLEIDTDENAISDSDEDFDQDNLSNLDEYTEGTEPFNPDTDEDTLSDGDEVYNYGTEPLDPDTDDDDLQDGDEGIDGIIYKQYGILFDPLDPDTDDDNVLDGDEVFSQTMTQEVVTEDEAVTEVTVDMNTNGNIAQNLTIQSMKDVDVSSSNVVGLVGEPFDFTSETQFDSATITFRINQDKLGETRFENLMIMWYNEEEGIFEEMSTTHDKANSIVKTTTTHFSQYMVVDRQKWYDNWAESIAKLQTMWNGGTSYRRILKTIFVVDCSQDMSTDNITQVLKVGFNGVTTENIDELRSNMNTAYMNLCANTCQRIRICENIIRRMNTSDYAAVVTFSNTVETESSMIQRGMGDTADINGNMFQLYNALQNVHSNGTNSNITAAMDKALQYVTDEETTQYRIILLTHSGVTLSSAASWGTSEKWKHTALNIVNFGPNEMDDDVESVVKAKNGDVYNAITADELTTQVGDMIVIPPQFNGTDSDGDGVPDFVEKYGLKPNGTPIDSNPNKKDSDDDNLDDNVELGYVAFDDVLLGYMDYLQHVSYRSDPNEEDSDGDSFPDKYNQDRMSTKDYYPYDDPNPLKSDITEIELRNEFISVDYEYKDGAKSDWSIERNDAQTNSYGGYQGWFGSFGNTGDKQIFCNDTVTGYSVSSDGCGLISIADIFLYLAIGDTSYNPTGTTIDLGNSYTNIDFDTYVSYVISISDYFSIYQTPMMSGMVAVGLSGSLESGVETICSTYEMHLTATWESSTNKENTLEKIEEMISRDIPVLFSYNVTWDNELQLYRLKEHQYTIDGGQTVSGHYMVITGVAKFSDDVERLVGRGCMLRIATYGKEYYVDYDEYAEQLSSIDTNIMYIKK